MRFISLFAGIGGFDLGFERAGMTCVGQVEIDDYCRAVLAKHWPNVPRWNDVRDVGSHNLPAADLICGGFPCQPHSLAGKRRGAADDRDLWPEYRRIVAELRPAWVVGENTPGIITTILDAALSDLEGLGYATTTLSIPACAFDAPHKRQRIYIIAHRSGDRLEGSQRQGAHSKARKQAVERRHTVPDDNSIGRDRGAGELWPGWGTEPSHGYRWESEPGVGRVVHGLSGRVDRIRALGNAVVPQVAEWLGRRIMEANQ